MIIQIKDDTNIRCYGNKDFPPPSKNAQKLHNIPQIKVYKYTDLLRKRNLRPNANIVHNGTKTVRGINHMVVTLDGNLGEIVSPPPRSFEKSLKN